MWSLTIPDGSSSGRTIPLIDSDVLRQAEVLLRNQRAEEALKLLQQLPQPCRHPAGQLLMGDALRRIGDSEAAIAVLAELARELEMDPTKAPLRGRTYGILGLAHRNLGRFREAAEALLTAIEAEPSHLSHYNALQFTRLNQEDVAALLPRLSVAVDSVVDALLPQQLLAEWQRRCGIEKDSLVRSYGAARRGCPPLQRSRLDPGAIPTPPDALIIGAPKSGTTSLMAWLNLHPMVWAHPRKELHFFDNHWEWGAAWYACQFPVFDRSCRIVRLEATPNLFQLPECPERVRQTMPEGRLILLLRDPLQRAVSWIHHMGRQEGLHGETERILEEEMTVLEAMTPEERHAIGWHAPNGLAGSLYSSFLPRWQTCFPPQRLLVLCLEDLIGKPAAALGRLQEFLDLPLNRSAATRIPHLNAAPSHYEELSPSLITRINQGLLADSRQLWSGFRIV